MNVLIREEFDWCDVNDYLQQNVNTVIIGTRSDPRSDFFPHIWDEWRCNIIQLETNSDSSRINVIYKKGKENPISFEAEFLVGLKSFLTAIHDDLKIICVDISGLQHTVLMYLCKLIIRDIKPMQFFATYTEPKNYLSKSHLGDYLLSKELLGLRSVPGFTLREKTPIYLLAFLGFEGNRLIKIIEEKEIETLIPIIGFPSYQPEWQTCSLRNCIRAIERVQGSNNIHKCRADSVFDAYDLISKAKPTSKEIYALAPLGTRPHTVACAIYATKYPETMIIYDHPIEVKPRSEGVLRNRCFHLTSFINII
jgi:hypothetical protein